MSAKYFYNSHTRQRGFTIVELLIVIVIIAILAAITIVAYNGIQNRAKQSAAQSRLTQANKKILAWAVINNDEYPGSLSIAGVDNSDNGLQYSVNNTATPRTYGLTSTNGTFSYYVSSSSSTPTAGAYVGHGANGIAAVTNLISNPNIEASINGYGAANGSTVSRIATTALGGTYAGQITLTSGGTVSSGARLNSGGTSSIGVQANTTYTLSLDVRASSSRQVVLSGQAGGVSGSTSTTVNVVANQTQRVSTTFTTNSWASSNAVELYLLRTDTNAGTILFKNVALYVGDVTYGYADGNSTNWVWNDTANASTSTGPPVQ